MTGLTLTCQLGPKGLSHSRAYLSRNLYIATRRRIARMGNIREYKRSKKLYASGEDWTFVKPRHWCEEIEIDGLILRKGEPVNHRGELVAYNYYIEDYG